jgi:hypothetical protein
VIWLRVRTNLDHTISITLLFQVQSNSVKSKTRYKESFPPRARGMIKFDIYIYIYINIFPHNLENLVHSKPSLYFGRSLHVHTRRRLFRHFVSMKIG